MSSRLRHLAYPSLILASPFDMQYLRDLTKRLHDQFVRDRAGLETVQLFAWETATRAVPFDDRMPAQAQLPSPADPLCRGVIAFFGEWIGRDLPPDQDKTALARLGAEDERQPFRLVHPWQDGAEEAGGFPLTGSTFEVLTAIAALKKPALLHAPPLLLLFVGPPNIAAESYAPKAGWGNWRLREQIVNDYQNVVQAYDRRTIDTEDSARAHAAMCRQRESIDSHLKKLRNFHCYLNTVLTHVSSTAVDETDAERKIRYFLYEVIDRTDGDTNAEQAFKGLGFFDVKDSAVYYGRETAVTTALAHIERLWRKENSPHLLWVRGKSGAGKSSFLRAGLIGNMPGISHSGQDCVKLVVRPHQLDDMAVAKKAHQQRRPLRRLFCHCLAAARYVGADDPALVEDLVALDAAEDPTSWAVETLRVALETSDDGIGRRLALGLDQFEEIVDRLEDPDHHPVWHELISFVLRLAELPAVMVIATMRDDRAEALKRHDALDAIYRATKNTLRPLKIPDGEDLANIIRKPLSSIRDLVLEPSLIDKLIDRVSAFSSKKTGTQDSCLPLIGLTLDRLYREVAKPLIAEYRNFGSHAAPADPPDAADDQTSRFQEAAKPGAERRSGAYLTIAIAENYQDTNYLDVKSAIAALAEEAVQATKDAAGPNWDDFEIAGLLRRLVSWASTAEQPFSLPAVAWPKGRVARTLATEMQKRRLVIDEEGGRIRLVHEAVVWNWPAAKEWLEFERPLLQDLPALLGMATKRRLHPGRENEIELPPLYREPALRLLALWFELLEEVDPANDAENKVLLRDFCLETLTVHGTASAVVQGTPRLPTHFMLAVSYAQLDLARRMLAEDGAVVNRARRDGRTPIFFPCFENDVKMLDLLLSHGAQFDVEDEEGWRPIHAAAARGALDTGKRLVEKGARLDGKGAPNGITPLQLAASGNHLDFIDYLVNERHVDIEEVNDAGQTAVFYALSKDHVAALKALLALGAQKNRTFYQGTTNDFGWTLLHAAANEGFGDAVEILLEQGLDGNLPLANGFTPLHLAASKGHAQVVQLLAASLDAAGCPVDIPALDEWMYPLQTKEKLAARNTLKPDEQFKFDMTPLHLAVRHNHLDAIRVLLDYADVNAVTGAGATPLHVAAANDCGEAARLLMMRALPDTGKRDASGQTPLQTATAAKNWSVVRAMIESGVSLERRSQETIGGTVYELSPLQKTTVGRDWPAAHCYLRHAPAKDVIVNQRGPFGRTALHFAALEDAVHTVRLFIDEGGDVLARDDTGMSAIHYAARKGSDLLLEQLLRDHPEPLDASASAAPTPLHLAAYSGSGKAVQQLLSEDWMNDTADAAGLSAFHRAAQAGVLDGVRAIAAAGAEIAAPTRDGRFNALNFAAEAGAEDVVAWLLQSGQVPPDLTAPAGEAPVVTAIRYRRYGIAALLLDAGASATATVPATGHSLAECYENQIGGGQAAGSSPPRHAGLERALERAGFRLKLAELITSAPALQTSVDTKRNEDRAPMTYNPGATAFVLPDLPNGETDVWHAIAGEELGELLRRVSPIDGKWPVEPATTAVRRRKLPWYDDVALIHVRNAELDARQIGVFYLAERDELLRLQGGSGVIHQMNAKAPIRLTAQNVLDYLRFFCYFVRSDDGPFYLAEDAADPLLPQFGDSTARSVLGEVVRPAALKEIDEHGEYRCDAVVCYSNAIFLAEFAIRPTGWVEMLSDEPIAADLPGRIEGRLS